MLPKVYNAGLRAFLMAACMLALARSGVAVAAGDFPLQQVLDAVGIVTLISSSWLMGIAALLWYTAGCKAALDRERIFLSGLLSQSIATASYKVVGERQAVDA
jgi:hypothetical protein